MEKKYKAKTKYFQQEKNERKFNQPRMKSGKHVVFMT